MLFVKKSAKTVPREKIVNDDNDKIDTDNDDCDIEVHEQMSEGDESEEDDEETIADTDDDSEEETTATAECHELELFEGSSEGGPLWDKLQEKRKYEIDMQKEGSEEKIPK